MADEVLKSIEQVLNKSIYIHILEHHTKEYIQVNLQPRIQQLFDLFQEISL
jgi:hypothetical protein